MICSTINDQVIIKTNTGDKFVIPTAGVFVDVPTRDGTGGSMRRWFNMKELLLKNRVDPRTTADEASGALRICHEWLDCPEKSLAIRTIKQFLDSKREERRDETLLIMAELYGRDIASKLSKGVRERKFFFPCYFLKEAGFAKIVVNLYRNFTGCASACQLKIVVNLYRNFTGCASACQFPPKNSSSAIRVCEIFGGSKCTCWMRDALRTTKLADDRIKAAFETVKYLETSR